MNTLNKNETFPIKNGTLVQVNRIHRAKQFRPIIMALKFRFKNFLIFGGFWNKSFVFSYIFSPHAIEIVWIHQELMSHEFSTRPSFCCCCCHHSQRPMWKIKPKNIFAASEWICWCFSVCVETVQRNLLCCSSKLCVIKMKTCANFRVNLKFFSVHHSVFSKKAVYRRRVWECRLKLDSHRVPYNTYRMRICFESN